LGPADKTLLVTSQKRKGGEVGKRLWFLRNKTIMKRALGGANKQNAQGRAGQRNPGHTEEGTRIAAKFIRKTWNKKKKKRVLREKRKEREIRSTSEGEKEKNKRDENRAQGNRFSLRTSVSSKQIWGEKEGHIQELVFKTKMAPNGRRSSTSTLKLVKKCDRIFAVSDPNMRRGKKKMQRESTRRTYILGRKARLPTRGYKIATSTI